MTRHNLAGHISWLLSHPVIPPVGVREPEYTSPAAVAQSNLEHTEEVGIAEGFSRGPATLDGSCSIAIPDIGSQNFLRPTLPSTIRSKALNQELRDNLSLESMGRLSSASKSAKPALLSQQQQLATPSSTTGTSSLTARYAVFTGTSNGLITRNANANL